ncbi:MAG: gliding motility-associated C-terminal domain-containing protein, partial [Bacteroidales bacterium]|nr:gliding motility-associated C-terminal domain-containing protein [Bacteroidales bacterium]
GGATASDVCDGTIVWTNDFTALSDDCGETGNALVTFTATDECGNSSTTSATFTIEDTTAPSWDTEALSFDRYLDCTDSDGLTIALALSPSATELCGTMVISNPSEAITETSCPNSYTLTRTWELSDDCGNSADPFVQEIIVSDNTPPTTNNLPDIYLSCDDSDGLISALALRPTFTDDCSPQMAIIVDLISDETILDCENTYVQTRQWQGTDLCGNSSFSQQRIFVTDTVAPTADPLQEQFILCKNDFPEPSIADLKNVYDNCSSAVLIDFVSDISNGKRCPETIIRSYSLKDDCGNESIIKQTIIIHDTLPPTADDIETSNFARIEEVPLPSIDIISNAKDNCTENPIISILSTDLYTDYSPPYYIHTYLVEDECQNQTQIMHQLTINDFPWAENDTFTIDENSINNRFTILKNDFFGYDGPGEQNLWINSSPFYGEISINDNGTTENLLDDFFVYTPNRNYFEGDTFEYSIFDKSGDEARAQVQINFTPNPLHIPEAFSPNGDGINEFFHIRGLYYYPENSIIIYDEKGDKVFESDPYDNDWDGTNHFSINPFEILPQATYFYILNLGDGSKPIKGYIYINRLK